MTPTAEDGDDQVAGAGGAGNDPFRASVDDLKRSPPVRGSGEKSIADQLDDERLHAVRAANKYRRTLVEFTLGAVGTLLGMSNVLVIAYFISQWEHIEVSVVIAYFASVVAETIGILYVISKYLFPDSGPPELRGPETSDEM